jgi:hypothetical protein
VSGRNSASRPTPGRRRRAPKTQIESNTAATATREFDVTLLTTRCGTTVVRVAAADPDDVLRVVDRELSSGEHIAPPEHCTDDVQTEVCAIREIH